MSDKASAFLSGVGSGGLMGYLPQVQAGVEGLLPNPTADVDAKLKAQGFNIKQPGYDYVKSRDQFANQINQQATQSPGYYAGGQLAGAIGYQHRLQVKHSGQCLDLQYKERKRLD